MPSLNHFKISVNSFLTLRKAFVPKVEIKLIKNNHITDSIFLQK